MRGESEVWRTLGKLTPTERRICTAFPTGAEVDLRAGDARIDDPASADDWPPTRAVRADVLAALLLGAGRTFPGRVAALRLRGARITGPLLLAHGRIAASWLLEQCRIDEHIDLEGAQTGSVYLRGSHLRTLSAYNAHIDGVLAVSGATITGTGTNTETGADALALYADSVTIAGDLRARETRVTGPVSLIGADISGQVILIDASISNPGGKSLNAGGMQVGRSLNCIGMNAVGEVRLPGVQIGSSLVFNGATLDGAGGTALSATGLTVASDVSFRQESPGAGRCFESRGVMWMPGARIGGNLYLSGAKLDGGGSTVALHARRASVDGSVNLDRGFSTRDEVRLTAARIGGLLDISGMTSPDALLVLYGANVAGGIRDVGDCWPGRVDLDGLTYGPFDPYLPARRRLTLLRRQIKTNKTEPGGYRAQPYEQLAAYYRGLGNDGQARTVLLGKSRAARATQPWYRRLPGYLLDGLVGFGYRPSRAIGWALALLIGASVYYSTVTPTRVDTQNTSDFNPVLYTADQLIPVIRFGQPEIWQFHGAAAAVGAVLTVLGWTLGIAIAAGASRALTRT